MPVALIAMSVLVMLGATTPPDGFAVLHEQESGFVQINWHDWDRYSDPTPNGRRHPQINTVARNIRVHEIEESSERPNWYNSMSEMLPVDEPVQTRWRDREANIEPSQQVRDSVGAGQVTTPLIIEHSPERKVRLPGVMLVSIAIVLTLSTIEVLFRCTVKEES